MLRNEFGTWVERYFTYARVLNWKKNKQTKNKQTKNKPISSYHHLHYFFSIISKLAQQVVHAWRVGTWKAEQLLPSPVTISPLIRSCRPWSSSVLPFDGPFHFPLAARMQFQDNSCSNRNVLSHGILTGGGRHTCWLPADAAAAVYIARYSIFSRWEILSKLPCSNC